ncbi:heat-shock protein Hsp20 [Sporanaerobium hydrogeniformans]|uniref:Heat-shock protein Hsp20 n=1 Tax=Sporanaerobium hydrogeniformans TaxID=3072179 RepID=A0AC61DBU3_9FIRM|nr:Hsp20/alpha crystallin family protein [Sporanaerobium hydrogeniformans]PHV70027.1 heat-shock protein Hsp20 [Sporanaerobium hydrogeniformans]
MFGLTPFNRNTVQRTTNDVTDFYNAIDDFFNDSFFPLRNLRNDTFKVDIRETDKEYLIEAEVPGIKKEEIQLDYDKERLIIYVQRKQEVNEDKDNYIHRERRITSMQRSIYLKNIDEKAIEAKLEEGILRISAPKQTITEIPKHRIMIE